MNNPNLFIIVFLTAFAASASFAGEKEGMAFPSFAAIRASGLTIYDPVEVGSRLWIPSPELETLLEAARRGMDLAGMPLRTRSKRVRARVCEAMGYRAPKAATVSRATSRYVCAEVEQSPALERTARPDAPLCARARERR